MVQLTGLKLARKLRGSGLVHVTMATSLMKNCTIASYVSHHTCKFTRVSLYAFLSSLLMDIGKVAHDIL